MQEPAIRVAVCDDAPAVKLFMRHVLEEDGDMTVVSETSTGRDAVDDLGRLLPHALLLDLLLPDVADPSLLVRQCRERSPETAILLISNLPAPQLEEEADRLGADAWLPKAQKPEALRTAVRRLVAAGRRS
jgi:two-component system, NarL family, invasion response regulator UvrY